MNLNDSDIAQIMRTPDEYDITVREVVSAMINDGRIHRFELKFGEDISQDVRLTHEIETDLVSRFQSIPNNHLLTGIIARLPGMTNFFQNPEIQESYDQIMVIPDINDDAIAEDHFFGGISKERRFLYEVTKNRIHTSLLERYLEDNVKRAIEDSFMSGFATTMFIHSAGIPDYIEKHIPQNILDGYKKVSDPRFLFHPEQYIRSQMVQKEIANGTNKRFAERKVDVAMKKNLGMLVEDGIKSFSLMDEFFRAFAINYSSPQKFLYDVLGKN